jgi:carboxyl-terminal processing protease
MLPRDPHDPSVDGSPDVSAADPGTNAVTTETGTHPTPLTPTGLVDEPIPTPVAVQPRERRRGWPFAVAMVLVTVMGGGALFMSGYSVGRDQERNAGTPVSEEQAWQPFWDVYSAVRTRYPLGPVDRQTLVEGAIRGLVESVGDPYSSYLSPEDFRGTLDDISGTFEGIGAEIGSVDSSGNASDCATYGPDCHLVIIAPIEGSPAEEAGLRPGDVIQKVDGSTLDGLSRDEARDRVRGKAGSTVVLHIQRFEAPTPAPATQAPATTAASAGSPAPGGTTGPEGSPAPAATTAPRDLLEEFDVTLARRKIQRKEVTARELADGTVGYIRLNGFSDAGADEVDAALQADVKKGIKKIVLDLRGNPGGFLTDARRVASAFLGDGTVFWQENAQGVQTRTDALDGGVATDPSVDVVVLIDRGTASASEIVAGALQDRGRAKLIGETTFGKGTVQEWLDLGEVGGVKLTVSKWLTPDKHWIHKVGLTPDVPVTVPADLPAGSDPVLDKALEELAATAAAPVGVLRAA